MEKVKLFEEFTIDFKLTKFEESFNTILNEGSNREKYEKIKDAGIKELDSFVDDDTTPLAKKINRSTKAFFVGYGNAKDPEKLKALKDKHLAKVKEYVEELKQLEKDMKEKEGKGLIKRAFSKRIKQASYALNTYKKTINHWK